jgi:N-acetylated-alpha-linked acidic dipeptidase
MLLELSDSRIIPYNLRNGVEFIRSSLSEIASGKYASTIESLNITLEFLEDSIDNFDQSIQGFMSRHSDTEHYDANQIRMVNDQIMLLERIFILPQGVPGRPRTRNAIFAPSKYNAYGASAFPGLIDLLFDADKLKPDELQIRGEEIKKHISDLMIMMNNAAKFLRPPAASF